MKIVIAVDSFKGSLKATEAADCIEAGIRRALSGAQVSDAEIFKLPKADGGEGTTVGGTKIVKLPMADGGEGTAEVITQATGGQWVTLPVSGPLGDRVSAKYGISGDTAVIEMAEASGINLLPRSRLNPKKTSTYGTGQLILDALERGCRKILLGIGGSATNDGGAGMAAALGARFFDRTGNPFVPTGGTLSEIERIDVLGLSPLLRDAEITVACDVTNPLCGETGASYVFAPQKGASPDDAVLLERNMKHYANKLRECLGVDVSSLPGGGAAGGLGAGLYAFLGARMKRGFEVVAEAVHLKDAVSGADLVITGEGCTDEQTACGKLPSGVAAICKSHGIPCFLVSGAVKGDLSALYACGITAAFSAVTFVTPLDDALAHAKEYLIRAAENAVRAFIGGR